MPIGNVALDVLDYLNGLDTYSGAFCCDHVKGCPAPFGGSPHGSRYVIPNKFGLVSGQIRMIHNGPFCPTSIRQTPGGGIAVQNFLTNKSLFSLK